MAQKNDNPKVRLFVEAPLEPHAEVELGHEQAHYLCGVMRRKQGDSVGLFNGRDGEWSALIVAVNKRAVTLICQAHNRPQTTPPDLWLAFAPVKKAHTDFIVAKACEMGCRRLLPVITQRTNTQRVNCARLRAIAIEAAEQCGRLCVPEVDALQPLERLLKSLTRRRILFCDETGAGNPAPTLSDAVLPSAAARPDAPPDPWLILIGPEGGFADSEATGLRARDGVFPIGLGPRLLRADTAAVAALALWQTAFGDWR